MRGRDEINSIWLQCRGMVTLVASVGVVDALSAHHYHDGRELLATVFAGIFLLHRAFV